MKTLAILGFGALILTSCSKTETKEIDTADKDQMVLKEDQNVDQSTKEKTSWDEVDLTSPVVTYDEVKSKDIEVRGNEEYSVYSVDEEILFDVDKASIRKDGEDKLKEVINSAKKRHPEGEIAVYGYTDATGTEEHNKELAEERAKTVADYIEKNSDFEEDEINVVARGEENPTATNETERGRQKNRRVEIAV